ncbi:MAG: glycosyltransferase family 2 protein [Planctomycetota bacterium]
MQTPLMLVVFNRPDHVLKSFERVRQTRPQRLFIASDGPRADRQEERQAVMASRAIAEQVDWPCRVTKIYSDTNLGCAKRVSTAIDTAFDSVDRLCILEDDCVADSSFFRFVDCLMDRHEDDDWVTTVTGNNHQDGLQRGSGDYYFSKYSHCWGWATWRRAWKHFDFPLKPWRTYVEQKAFCEMLSERLEYKYWLSTWEAIRRGKLNSWAIPWLFSQWSVGGLTATPNVNLVENIGFDDRATHTSDQQSALRTAAGTLEQFRAPADVARCVEADRFVDAKMFSGTYRRPNPIKQFRQWYAARSAA